MNGAEDMTVEDLDRELAARGVHLFPGLWSHDCPMTGDFAASAYDALVIAKTPIDVLKADGPARDACRQMDRQAAAFRSAAAALRERNPFLLRHDGAGCCAVEVRLLLSRASGMDLIRARKPEAGTPDPAPVLARIAAEFDAAAEASAAWAESLSVLREMRTRPLLADILAQVKDQPRVTQHIVDACGREVTA